MLKPGLSDNVLRFGAQINPDPKLILATVQAAVPVRPHELASHAAGEVVKFWAQALPGPGGVLTAPLSGQRCVWYRSWFYPMWTKGDRSYPDTDFSDAGPALGHARFFLRRSMNTSEEISTAAFAVGEQGGAQLLVDPLVADVDIDLFGIRTLWRGRRGISKGMMVEWVLPPTTPVLVVGRLGPDGRVTADAGAALLITTRDEDGVVARHRGDSYGAGIARARVRNARIATRGRRYLAVFLVGLVIAVVLFVLLISIAV